jgi:hypothetical protein
VGMTIRRLIFRRWGPWRIRCQAGPPLWLRTGSARTTSLPFGDLTGVRTQPCAGTHPRWLRVGERSWGG